MSTNNLLQIISIIKSPYSSQNEVDSALQYLDNLEKQNQSLKHVVETYRMAALAFITKCDYGLARSRDSYAQFKKCIEVDDGSRGK